MIVIDRELETVLLQEVLGFLLQVCDVLVCQGVGKHVGVDQVRNAAHGTGHHMGVQVVHGHGVVLYEVPHSGPGHDLAVEYCLNLVDGVSIGAPHEHYVRGWHQRIVQQCEQGLSGILSE